LIGIGGKPKEDHLARYIERHATCFQSAQISHGVAEREGQLLRFRSARGMNRTAIRSNERPAVSLIREFARQLSEKRRDLFPSGHATAG
jgi:hypothetical protein